MKEKLLEVKGLKTDFISEGLPRRIVDDISFYIDKGEVPRCSGGIRQWQERYG